MLFFYYPINVMSLYWAPRLLWKKLVTPASVILLAEENSPESEALSEDAQRG